MEFILHIPTELDKVNPLTEMWNIFSQRFQEHFSEKKSKLPNISKSSFLLFAAQHKLDELSLGLKARNISLNVTYEVLEVIESVCLPFFLLLFERFRLFTRSQKSSESVSSFAQSLLKQVDLCQFDDLKLKESILTKTLITGIADKEMREKLLLKRNIGFEDVVNKCDSAFQVEQTLNSPKANIAAGTSNGRKVRGRKRKTQSDTHQSDVKKLYVSPIDNDDHEDADLDDAKIFIDNLKLVSQGRKEKFPSNEINRLRVSKQLKVLKCFACSNEYFSQKSLREHVQTQHADLKTLYCVHCNVKFKTRKECFAHCFGHQESFYSELKSGKITKRFSRGNIDTTFMCWYCGETQANLAEYKEHCEKHSAAVRVYTCDICQKKSHSIIRLIGHLKGHSVAKHKCEICGNRFARPDLVAAHMKTHVNEPRHQCKICMKSFVSADRLQCHMRTHTGEKRFTCELCGKCFSQKMSFDYHKRWHAGEKPYECDICGRRTICFGDLKKHKRMHSDKRPYVCEVCGKSFRFVSNLNRHRKGHTGKRMYVCEVCGRSFIYNEGLRDHIKAGRCPGLKSEAGAAGGRPSHRGPKSRSSNTIMNLAVNGNPPIAVAPQFPQPQSNLSPAYISKTILNPVNLSNNLVPGLLSSAPACSPSPSGISTHQQHEASQLQVPCSATFVQVSAPPQSGHSQQQISQHNATVTCTLPEYMNDFTAWPQYMIRNSVTMAESTEVVGQPATNVVIVPPFY